jgi:hypothetical protein
MELLPLISTSSWKHQFDYMQNRVIQPGFDLRVEWRNKGWIRYVVGITNNPYTTIEHNVFGGKQISVSVYQLYALGITTPAPAGTNWVQTWDPINNIYVVCYTPVPPQEIVPNPVTYISAYAPTVDPLTELPILTPTTMSILYDSVIITDEEKFKEDLKAILGNAKLK